MNRKIEFILTAAISLFAVSSAFSQEAQDTIKAASANSSITTTQPAYPQTTIDLLTAPIRSKADLQTYLKMTPISASPLGYLSPSSRKLFLSSLVFTKDGLGSLQYKDLQGLSATQAYQILGLFGWQTTLRLIDKLNINTALDKLIMKTGDVPNTQCYKDYVIDTSAVPPSCVSEQSYLCCPRS